MNKKTALCFLFLLAAVVLQAGNDTADIGRDIKELEAQSREARGNRRVDVLNDLAYAHISISPAKCIQYAQQALTQAKASGYVIGQARALQNLGIGNAITGKPQTALEFLQNALETIKKTDDRKRYAKILDNIGTIYYRIGKPQKALEFQLESLKLERELGNTPGIASVLSNIGITKQHLFDSAGALDYYLQSLKMYDSLEDKNRKIQREVSNVLMNIGIVYVELNRPKEGQDHLRRALKIKETIGDKAGTAQVYGSLAAAHQILKEYAQALEINRKALTLAEEIGLNTLIPRCTGNIGAIYVEMKDYNGALKYYRRSLAVGKETGDKLIEGLALASIGKVQVHLRDYKGALKNIRQSLAIAAEIKKKDLELRGYKYLARLYEDKGDFKNALEYYKRLHQTDKDLLAEANQQQVNRLQARYQSEQKAKEIEVLTKTNEIKDLRLEKAALTRNTLIAGFVMVSFILALLFKKYLYLFAFWKRQKHVGRFRLIDKIAAGGMGTVYKARSITDRGAIAAVKVLKDELFTHEISKKRFKRESALTDKLEHPHIVEIIERGESNNQLYIAMEHLEGETLEQRMDTNGPLPIGQSLHIMKQVTQTIAFIHGKNIIHRDLKPANIMLVSRDGDPDYVKLLDFGLARMEFDTRITHTGNFLGTGEYISPEQILDADSSPAGDLFAMGVTFYRMLCGRSPFPGETALEIMNKIIRSDPEAVSLLRPGIPAQLDRLVMQLLDKQPGKRPTAAQASELLGKIRADSD